MYCSQKLSIQQDIMSGNGKEAENQGKHAVHRLTREHNHHRTEDGEKGKDKEGNFRHLVSA